MLDLIDDFSAPLTILAIVGGSLFGLYVVLNLIGLVFGAVGALFGLVFGAIGAVFGLVGGLIGRVGLFAGRQVQDSLHLAGGLLTGIVIAPLALANLALGRSRSAGSYGRAFKEELAGSGASLYRLALGNPIWLLGLGPLTEGLERRLPDLISRVSKGERASRSGTPHSGTPQFEGYQVTGELEPGGSGARLFLAIPSEDTLARYRAGGHGDPGQVVLKSFALTYGSTLPQIVRESRSLEAARKLGTVLDHELTDDSFWYAMPFVPGENLDVVTRRLHARSGPAGLDDESLARVLGFSSDLLATLDRFHRAGLWHKDIKPSNLIISGERAHLVDLGLVTPLASAMTLTTHGTEFFRDPELVRLAMQGVKVQDVDGVKFDLYSVGAVLYSMLENSFPAHGNLSRLEKRCPEALSWILRRSMADLSQRYGSANEMSRDLDVLLASRDPWAVKPADLPSMGAPTSGRPQARGTRPRRAALAGPGHRKPSLDPVPSAPPARKRTALRGLLKVALFLVMFSGMTVLARTAWSRAQNHRITIAQGTFLGDRSGSPGRVRIAGRHADRSPDGSGEHGESMAREDLSRLGRAGRLLLLAGAGVDPRHAELDSLRAHLRERGHTLLGEGDDPASIELVALARNTAGLSGLSDSDTARQLQEFVDGRDDLDALVWFGPHEGDRIRYRIFVRGER
jgi:serine/threonine protein kinase